RSGPKRASIGLKDCILFPIGVFLLGLTYCVSQFAFFGISREYAFLMSPFWDGRKSLAFRRSLEVKRPCADIPDDESHEIRSEVSNLPIFRGKGYFQALSYTSLDKRPSLWLRALEIAI